MLKREVRTRLSFLHQSKADHIAEEQQKYFHGNREVDFEEGEKVYIRDYKNPMKPTWTRATVQSRLGSRTFMCKIEDTEGPIVKRHTDQLIKRGDFYSAEAEIVRHSVSDPVVIQREPNPDNTNNSTSIVEGEPDFDEAGGSTKVIESPVKESPGPRTSSAEIQNNQTRHKSIDWNINSRPKRIIKPIQRLNL